MPQAENFMDEIAEICKNGPAGLSEEQAGFLRARRSYLTPEQEEQFADVLGADAKKDQSFEPTWAEIKERAEAISFVIPNKTKKADALKMVEEAEAQKALKPDDSGEASKTE